MDHGGQKPHGHDSRYQSARQTLGPGPLVIAEPAATVAPAHGGCESGYRSQRGVGRERCQLGTEFHVPDVRDRHASGFSRMTMRESLVARCSPLPGVYFHPRNDKDHSPGAAALGVDVVQMGAPV